MIDSIDDAIASAAPPVAKRGRELEGLVERVVEERIPRRRRGRRRMMLGTAVLAVLIGGTSASLATPDFRGWWWSGSPDRTVQRVNATGELCTIGYKILADVGFPETDPAVIAAREILSETDIENLQIDQAKLEENRASVPKPLDPDGVTISNAIITLVVDGVRARGLDPAHFSIGGDGRCGDEDGSRDDWN
ncbi:hypothetical protein [Agromyces ramosus]|uniref:Uncharacterized protein n=1 Tax=Agromyces ramosus TaxID=33879 RepID=A0ABU0RDA0_9MICO|nr:hypothetical protein [Agromyces ramosus]MDQ0896054.1 hypothetical protein [Agromyces ramosus]